MGLALRSRNITGILRGSPVNCIVTSLHGFASPAPGRYNIQAPTTDPVFGLFMKVTPVSAGDTRKDPGTLICAVNPEKSGVRNNSGTLICMVNVERTGGLFVISERAVPGTSCVVVGRGLAALATAVQQSGASELTVY